jgi:transposase InsO family protein
LQGRLELVQLIAAGATFRAAAAALGVAPATAHRWWVRWQRASDVEQASRACLRTKSTRPKSCPWALDERAERKILDARERTNWGPMRLTALTGRHRSTIWKVLKRHGVSRRRRGQRQTFKRFEWSQPGALLHIDAYCAPKFLQPGHRVTGDRDKHNRARNLGKTVVIAVQDDHSRIVYAELHSAENAANVSITLKRAAAWMREQGCGPLEAVMSDNAKCYTGFVFADTLAELGARHVRIPPYTPRWNGKLERFFGTLEDEWAHGRVWSNSATRDRALSSFIRYYNRWRPHSAAGGRPPITRVH